MLAGVGAGWVWNLLPLPLALHFPVAAAIAMPLADRLPKSALKYILLSWEDSDTTTRAQPLMFSDPELHQEAAGRHQYALLYADGAPPCAGCIGVQRIQGTVRR